MVYDKKDIISHLYVLSEWSLIPIQFSNDKNIYIAPIGSLSLILHNEDYEITKELRNLFNSLNLPCLAPIGLPLLNTIAVDLKKFSDLLDIFQLICDRKVDILKNLDPEKRRDFLIYLTNHLKCVRQKELPGYKNRILSLSLFQNVFDELMPIYNKNVIILHKDIPINGLQQVFPSANYFVCKNDESFKDIYSMFAFKKPDFQGFYEQYLGLLGNLNFENKNIHMLAIKNEYEIMGNISEALINKLKSFQFIKTKGLQTFSASQYFDPTVKLFRIIYRNNVNAFPTQPYDTDAWIPFLRIIGLKRFNIINENTINEYLQLAIDNFDACDLKSSVYVFSKLFKIISGFSKQELLGGTIESFKASLKFLIENINLNGNEDLKSLFIQIYSLLKNIYEKVNRVDTAAFFESIKSYNLILHEFEKNDNILVNLSPVETFIEKDLRKFEQIEGYLYIYPEYLHEYKDMFSYLGLNSEINYELCVKILAKQKKDKNVNTFDAIKAMNLLFKCTAPEFLVNETLDLFLLNGRSQFVEASTLYYIDKDVNYHLYNTDFCKNNCLIPLDTIASEFSKYRLYNNKWEPLIKILLPQHQPKKISRFITKEMIMNNDMNESVEEQELVSKVKNNAFIQSIKQLLGTESIEIDNFFMNAKFYKPNILRTQKYFKRELIIGSELNEKTSTKFDDKSKSIHFYRNTIFRNYTYKNLCACIVEGLEKYYYKSEGSINESTSETILELLLEQNEEMYEELLNEHNRFH